MYQAMMDRIEEDTIRYLYFLQPAVEESLPRPRREQPMQLGGAPQQASPPRTKQARSVIPKKRKKKKKKR
jgi:preprotein translocase subunit SecA